MAGEETEFVTQEGASEPATSGINEMETTSTDSNISSDEIDFIDSESDNGETAQEETGNNTSLEQKEDDVPPSEPAENPVIEPDTEPSSDTSANNEVSDVGNSTEANASESENLDENEEVEEVEESAAVKLGAISGSTTIAIGETTALTSNRTGYRYYRWTLSDNISRNGNATTSNDYVRISNSNTSTTTVTGLRAGTTTIYYQGRNSTNNNWNRIDSVPVTVKRQVKFTLNVSDAEVVLYHYTTNDLSDLEMVGVVSSNGSITSNYDARKPNYWVFMAKPSDNYLLTGLGATGAGDIYPISNSSYGNIQGYPSIHTLTNQYGEGYYAVFGYSRGANATLNDQTLNLVGQSPAISVSATPDTAVDLSPGQVVNLTLEVTPGQLTGRSVNVNSVALSNLNIGGNPITINGSDTVTLTKNSQGRYVVTVPYTITEADCANPTLAVAVDGAVEYSFTVSTTGGKITTVSTVRSSASTSVKIADYRTVTYSYIWDSTPDHVSPGSSAVFPAVPTDTGRYYYGQDYTINVDSTVPTNYSSVQDQANKGHWEFDGWYRNNTGDKVTNVSLSKKDDDGLHFIGRWHFVLDYMPLTFTKNVTGNLGDKTKEFPFDVTVTKPGEEPKTYSFSLKDAESHTLEDLPIGSTITIQERQNEGYVVGVTYNGSPATNNKDGSWFFTLEEGKDQVAVTNYKEANPDTNVHVDSVPYILMLLIMFGAVLVLIQTRRQQWRN